MHNLSQDVLLNLSTLEFYIYRKVSRITSVGGRFIVDNKEVCKAMSVDPRSVRRAVAMLCAKGVFKQTELVDPARRPIYQLNNVADIKHVTWRELERCPLSNDRTSNEYANNKEEGQDDRSADVRPDINQGPQEDVQVPVSNMNLCNDLAETCTEASKELGGPSLYITTSKSNLQQEIHISPFGRDIETSPLSPSRQNGVMKTSKAPDDQLGFEDFDTPDTEPTAHRESSTQVAARLIGLMCDLSGRSFKPTESVTKRVQYLLRTWSQSQLETLIRYHFQLCQTNEQKQYFNPGFTLTSKTADRWMNDAEDWQKLGEKNLTRFSGQVSKATGGAPAISQDIRDLKMDVAHFKNRFLVEHKRYPTFEEVRAFVDSKAPGMFTGK